MLNFLIVGDWGRRGSPAQRVVARGMACAAQRLGSAFVLSTGDNFYDDGVASTADAHWQESFEQVYTAPALRVPWYAALGNHDYQGRPEAQIAYTRTHPRWRMRGRSYAFTRPVGSSGATALFVVLDTTPLLGRYHPGGAEALPGVEGQDAAAQLAWLRRTLAASSATWKIVAGHHPVLNGSPFHGVAPEMQPLQSIFERHGVQAYLCGHEHDLQHLAAGGVHYVVSGAGAECRATGTTEETRFSQAALGFAACTLTEAHVDLRFFDAEARVLHRCRAEARAAALL